MTMQPPPPPGPPAYPTMTAPPPPSGRYGGFWLRLLGYIIDAIIVGGVTYGILAAVKPISCETVDGTTCIAGTTTISAVFYVILLIPILYFIVLWALGGTVGQRVLGMRVVSATTGGNIGFGRAILRYIGFIIATIPVYIGLMWVGWDPRKQGWHDKIAGTLVVRGRGSG